MCGRGPAPGGLVRPPKAQGAREWEGGQTLGQMGPKAHPGAPPPFPLPCALGLGGGRTSTPGAGPLPHLAHEALRGRWPHLVDPRTLPVVPVRYR